MKRWIITGCIIFAIPVFFLLSAHSQDDTSVIDKSVFEKPQRPASIFDHDEHMEVAEIEECNECHHIYEDGKKVADESSEDQMCSECHELGDAGNTPGLMKAYHKNCKGCHLAQKKGPVMCGECHKK